MDRPARLSQHPFAVIFALFALSRASVFLLVLAVRSLVPENLASWDGVALSDYPFWRSFCRWDAVWYDRIVVHGYYVDAPANDTAFFPAFPYFARWLGKAVGSSWAAGLAISHLSTLGALFFIYGIARRYLDKEGAYRAVFFVLVFPTSFYTFCFYSEGLYLFAIAGALYFYERADLLLAGIFGLLATMTRSTGVLLFPALLLGGLHRRNWELRAMNARWLWLFLIPLGLVLVMAILNDQVGDPLAFVHAQKGWARKNTFFLLTMLQAAQDIRVSATFGAITDLAAALGVFLVAATSLRRLDLAHSIFALLSIVMPLSSGLILSAERFASTIVPLHLMLAIATERREADRLVTCAMALSLSVHVAVIASGYHPG